MSLKIVLDVRIHISFLRRLCNQRTFRLTASCSLICNFCQIEKLNSRFSVGKTVFVSMFDSFVLYEQLHFESG